MRKYIVAIAINFMLFSPSVAQDWDAPVIACELTPTLCPRLILSHLEDVSANGALSPTELGIMAARLTRIDTGTQDANYLAQGLAIIGDAMRAFDPDLASRIETVARARGRANAPGLVYDPDTGNFRPRNARGFPNPGIAGPPIPASPS